jgi:Concanavalin A-like lectin/glucanases superfamily
MSANLVLHWHLDALTSESQAVDTSGNHLNGVVAGNPKNQPDQRFGSVLRFNGTSDSVSVADTPPLRITTYTVEGWINPDPVARAGLIGKPPDDLRMILNANGSLEHRFSTTAHADDGQVTVAGAITAGTWRHVAVTNDGHTARIFLDGVRAAEYAFPGDRVAAQVPLLVGGDGTTGFYAGLLAHIRIYDGALSDLEIQRDMADDEAALAAFVRSHPIDFTLTNQDQQAVLFIDDSPSGQPMTLKILNTSRQDIAPVPLTGDPSADNHHYALHLRAGTLALTPEPRVTNPRWSLLRAIDPATGDTVVYLMSTDPPVIGRGESYDLRLEGLNADGTGGTRGTRVELTYRQTRYAGEQGELTGTRVAFLDIVNHRGLRAIPLAAGFVGGNRVVNDQATSNTLRIRIANVSRDTALPFRGGSFTVSYDVQQAGEIHEWALVDSGHAARAVLGGLRADKVYDDWAITSENLGQRVVWTLTPRADTAFAPGGSIVVTLSTVFALTSLGQAAVVIGYRNVPGYQDGSITLLVEKAPLTFSGQSVGLGTNAPEGRLQIIDANEDSNGTTLILGPTAQSNLRLGYHQDYSWIQSHGSKPLSINALGNGVGVGTAIPEGRLQIIDANEDSNGTTLILGPTAQSNLRLGYHQDYSWIQSHGSKPLSINALGNGVGVGTTTPGSRLTVSSDATHLQLRREPNTTGGKVLYLELFQDSSPSPTYPSLRFHHSNIFWHRIEGRPEGLTFKTGDLSSDAFSDVYAGTAHLSGLSVGGVTIGAAELQVLQRLAAGQLQFDLWNVVQNEYAYAADFSPFDNDRRYVFTWRTKGQRVSQGRWQISFPS